MLLYYFYLWFSHLGSTSIWHTTLYHCPFTTKECLGIKYPGPTFIIWYYKAKNFTTSESQTTFSYRALLNFRILMITPSGLLSPEGLLVISLLQYHHQKVIAVSIFFVYKISLSTLSNSTKLNPLFVEQIFLFIG